MSQPNQPFQTPPWPPANRPHSPAPASPAPAVRPVPRTQRSLFATGFIVTMGVMVAVTVWAIAWGIGAVLILTVLAGIGGAGS